MKPTFPHFLHGGDYNPEQWLDRPDVLEKDVALMKEAHVNCVSTGIFAWSHLEPSEGSYDFDWLEAILNRLYDNGVYTVLATPSGAKPVWMSHKYPEIRRVSRNGVRDLTGGRHNHCYSSPIYREKVRQIDTALAERFSHHPGVILWHISNEFGGECSCPLCQEEFRNWLRERYGSLEELNRAWWTSFWSHRYTDWSQIEPPAPHGEMDVHGLTLDWKRFVTARTADFVRMERDAVKAVNPDLPVTINMMGDYVGLDYFRFRDLVDIVSWDSYPSWGRDADEEAVGQATAFAHDLMRSIRREPFLLMESTPSATNWQAVSKLKRPGVHMLAEMQAVAHGSNSVQYFQWRKSRGSSEKLHGAVVDHYGGSDTRVFQEVAEVGRRLEGLDGVLSTCPQPEAALIYDWENRWAVEDARGPRNSGLHYMETLQSFHAAFWKQGVPMDVIDMTCDLERYKLVIAPMVYLLRPGFAERLRAFTERGGTVLATYWSGIVNENDLCWLGGMPGDGLMELFGLRSEEIDSLYDGQINELLPQEDFLPGRSYELRELCDLVHCTTAKTLAVYGADFYRGMPALTVNEYGKGQAYYLAARSGQKLLDDLAACLCRKLGIRPGVEGVLPQGVTAIRRTGEPDVIFLQNFTGAPRTVRLRQDYRNYETGAALPRQLELAPYQVLLLTEADV